MNEVEEVIGEEGLTDHERRFLTTPMSQMDQDQKRIAIAVREKRDNKIYADNAAQRAADEANRKAHFEEAV